MNLEFGLMDIQKNDNHRTNRASSKTMSREICECDRCGSKGQQLYLSDYNEILCADCEADDAHEKTVEEQQ